jgi:hypothetical protein
MGATLCSPRGFRSEYEQTTGRLLSALPPAGPPLGDDDLAGLPPALRAFLRRVGVVGKPRVRAFEAHYAGRFRNGLNARWMRFTSEQRNTVAPPTRLFLMRASMAGIPMAALHTFTGPDARMRARIASVLQVVDATGDKMNQSETVTIFNDLCVMAPAALVDAPIRWTDVGHRSVRGAFTRGNQTVSALLEFDEDGDLVDFVSEDRYMSADGKTYERWPWRTPLRDYGDFGGFRLAGFGATVWKLRDGDFTYGEFNLQRMIYY